MGLVHQLLAPCRTSAEKHGCPAWCKLQGSWPEEAGSAAATGNQQELVAALEACPARTCPSLRCRALHAAIRVFLQIVAVDVLDTIQVMPEAGPCFCQSSVHAQVSTAAVLRYLSAPPSCPHSCSSMTPSPNPRSLQHAAQGLLIMHALLTSMELEGACCSSSSSSSGMHHDSTHINGFRQPMGFLSDPAFKWTNTLLLTPKAWPSL